MSPTLMTIYYQRVQTKKKTVTIPKLNPQTS